MSVCLIFVLHIFTQKYNKKKEFKIIVYSKICILSSYFCVVKKKSKKKGREKIQKSLWQKVKRHLDQSKVGFKGVQFACYIYPHYSPKEYKYSNFKFGFFGVINKRVLFKVFFFLKQIKQKQKKQKPK